MQVDDSEEVFGFDPRNFGRSDKMVAVRRNVADYVSEVCEKLSGFCGALEEQISLCAVSKLMEKENRDIYSKTFNYFNEDCSKRYLHYFQSNSKNVFLLDLSAIDGTEGNSKKKSEPGTSFEKITLNIDFNLPLWHKSVVLPSGEI